jgi:hypothetical protein
MQPVLIASFLVQATSYTEKAEEATRTVPHIMILRLLSQSKCSSLMASSLANALYISLYFLLHTPCVFCFPRHIWNETVLFLPFGHLLFVMQGHGNGDNNSNLWMAKITYI